MDNSNEAPKVEKISYGELKRRISEHIESKIHNDPFVKFYIEELYPTCAPGSKAKDTLVAVESIKAIDYYLKDLLKTKLVKDGLTEEKALEQINRDQSKVHRKIDKARSLGIISEKEKENLIALKNIRNGIDHEIETNTFTDDTLHPFFEQLNIVKKVFLVHIPPHLSVEKYPMYKYDLHGFPIILPEHSKPPSLENKREYFIMATMTLRNILEIRKSLIEFDITGPLEFRDYSDILKIDYECNLLMLIEYIEKRDTLTKAFDSNDIETLEDTLGPYTESRFYVHLAYLEDGIKSFGETKLRLKHEIESYTRHKAQAFLRW